MFDRFNVHPPWRKVLIALIGLPAVATLAVLVFAWPAARIAPRDVPVGVVGAGSTSQQALQRLNASNPGAFDSHLYADEQAARTAIKNRDIYGAFEVTPRSVTVLEAGAASPTVAQTLSGVGEQLATGASIPLRTVDVVPLSIHDPRGAVFSSVLLPVIICGIVIAAALGLLLRVRPAWRQVLVTIGVAAIAGAGVYLIAQGFLGALPHDGLATWAALSLAVLAISASASGLAALLGPVGLGLGGLLMVFLGNPFSGVTSAPELLPGAVRQIGQWLPPGAAAGLLRSTAYFDGHGSAGHLTVLLVWAVLGLVAIVVGHRRALVLVESRPPTQSPRHLNEIADVSAPRRLVDAAHSVGLHEAG